ncbi:hypothetical protein LRU_00414 [Ligilactobacillus ruminis SPM0211]|uniref:Uncharacterized protein n=1 Tax=Ligilactobacillus ruminis SPM0211 TaxID=1040964 RepID=F7QYC7_9LACO|nr:hypothetical protein LRU_00414 [Ligilactobacillus ruminis SPM0211]
MLFESKENENNPKQNASANLTGILTRLVEQHCIYQKEPF